MGASTVKINNFAHELIPVAVATKAVTIADTAGTLEGLGSFTFSTSTKVVQIAVKGYAVNVDPSGTAPTTSVGQPLTAGQVVQMSIAEAKLAKWIRQTSSSATADVNQYTY
jgi:ferric-dicitrate binding protein FerR (iron transport regulator)